MSKEEIIKELELMIQNCKYIQYSDNEYEAIEYAIKYLKNNDYVSSRENL